MSETTVSRPYSWLPVLIIMMTVVTLAIGGIGRFALSTLITHFLEEVPTRLSALQHAFQQGDGLALAQIAHELNGSSGNLGVRRMRQLCFDLQALGKAKDLSKAGSMLAQLVDEFELVRQRLMAEYATIAHDTLPDEA